MKPARVSRLSPEARYLSDVLAKEVFDDLDIPSPGLKAAITDVLTRAMQRRDLGTALAGAFDGRDEFYRMVTKLEERGDVAALRELRRHKFHLAMSFSDVELAIKKRDDKLLAFVIKEMKIDELNSFDRSDPTNEGHVLIFAFKHKNLSALRILLKAGVNPDLGFYNLQQKVEDATKDMSLRGYLEQRFKWKDGHALMAKMKPAPQQRVSYGSEGGNHG